jgi:hypothetical protein
MVSNAENKKTKENTKSGKNVKPTTEPMQSTMAPTRRGKENKRQRNSRKRHPRQKIEATVETKEKGRIGKVKTLEKELDVCICHHEYNHCVQNNINGEIPEILPSADLDGLNFTDSFVNSARLDIFGATTTTTTTTTQAPEVVEAMGYEVYYDAIPYPN